MANARAALANMLGRLQPTIREVGARLAPPQAVNVMTEGITTPPTPAKPMAKESSSFRTTGGSVASQSTSECWS